MNRHLLPVVCGVGAFFVTASASKLKEWEGRWFRAMRDNDRLRAKIGVLLRELSRQSDPR